MVISLFAGSTAAALVNGACNHPALFTDPSVVRHSGNPTQSIED